MLLFLMGVLGVVARVRVASAAVVACGSALSRTYC